MKTGVQLYSFCKLIEQGKIAEAVNMASRSGVDGVELYSIYDDFPALQFRKIMNDAGVECLGSHNYLDRVVNHTDEMMEYNYILGNKTIVCHYLKEEERGSMDNWKRSAEKLNKAGEILKRNGFDLLYHNHDFEFDEVFEGKSGYEIMLENTDPQLVGVELHVGQLPYHNIDMTEYINKMGRRIKYLHVHFIQREKPFDSHAAIIAGKKLDVKYAVIENVYPEPTLEKAREHVDTIRRWIRDED